MSLAPTRPDHEAIESLVDKIGLEAVLFVLAETCADKAAHIESAWQDKTLAAAWSREAIRLEKFKQGVRV